MTCAEFRALSAEFALGVLDARDRAFAVAHLERCAECRGGMRELATVADGLASLAPLVEPPNGFESRVLEALRTARRAQSARDWRRRAPFIGIAALLLVVAGFGGWALRGGGNATHPGVHAQLTAAELVSSHQFVGEVVINRAGSWVSMAVDLPNADAWATCEVLTKSHHTVVVGSFRIVHGYSYWAAALHGPMTIDGARLVGENGDVLASSTFPSVRVGNAT
jgi:hypothetical protein